MPQAGGRLWRVGGRLGRLLIRSCAHHPLCSPFRARLPQWGFTEEAAVLLLPRVQRAYGHDQILDLRTWNADYVRHTAGVWSWRRR